MARHVYCRRVLSPCAKARAARATGALDFACCHHVIHTANLSKTRRTCEGKPGSEQQHFWTLPQNLKSPSLVNTCYDKKVGSQAGTILEQAFVSDWDWVSRHIRKQRTIILCKPFIAGISCVPDTVPQTLHVCHICLHWGGLGGIHGASGYCHVVSILESCAVAGRRATRRSCAPGGRAATSGASPGGSGGRAVERGKEAEERRGEVRCG